MYITQVLSHHVEGSTVPPEAEDVSQPDSAGHEEELGIDIC